MAMNKKIVQPAQAMSCPRKVMKALIRPSPVMTPKAIQACVSCSRSLSITATSAVYKPRHILHQTHHLPSRCPFSGPLYLYHLHKKSRMSEVLPRLPILRMFAHLNAIKPFCQIAKLIRNSKYILIGTCTNSQENGLLKLTGYLRSVIHTVSIRSADRSRKISETRNKRSMKKIDHNPWKRLARH